MVSSGVIRSKCRDKLPQTLHVLCFGLCVTRCVQPVFWDLAKSIESPVENEEEERKRRGRRRGYLRDIITWTPLMSVHGSMPQPSTKDRVLLEFYKIILILSLISLNLCCGPINYQLFYLQFIDGESQINCRFYGRPYMIYASMVCDAACLHLSLHLKLQHHLLPRGRWWALSLAVGQVLHHSLTFYYAGNRDKRSASSNVRQLWRA